MGWLQRGTPRPSPLLLAAAAGLVALSIADGWRVALLAAIASAAIAATRIRYAPAIATGLVLVVAAVAIAGFPLGDDERPPHPRTGAHAVGAR